MTLHLQGDLSFSQFDEKKHPEYVHEVFQRLILNFLVANEREQFMDLKKSVNSRHVKGSGMKSGTNASGSGKKPYSRYARNSKSEEIKEDPEELNEKPEGLIVSIHRYQSNISIYPCPPVAKQETTITIASIHVTPLSDFPDPSDNPNKLTF
jgi:hypothetical protein